jgi:uncharacterized protein with HEPN domain
MRKDDEIRLRHMRDAAQEASTFSRNRSRSDLDHDRMLQHSLVRCIEIIGEAASQITKETQRQLPDIPWPNIVAMRNRLIHAYFDIDLDRVWDTVIDDLPPLIATLDKILPEAE